MNKILKAMFGVTLERPRLKNWRGHRVPFIVYVRRHTRNGSHVWFNLIGPNLHQWCKENWRRV